jgi:hypothetical protein
VSFFISPGCLRNVVGFWCACASEWRIANIFRKYILKKRTGTEIELQLLVLTLTHPSKYQLALSHLKQKIRLANYRITLIHLRLPFRSVTAVFWIRMCVNQLVMNLQSDPALVILLNIVQVTTHKYNRVERCSKMFLIKIDS